VQFLRAFIFRQCAARKLTADLDNANASWMHAAGDLIKQAVVTYGTGWMNSRQLHFMHVMLINT
jgi:hypothetical protein